MMTSPLFILIRISKGIVLQEDIFRVYKTKLLI
jgi:hypothetical protein